MNEQIRELQREGWVIVRVRDDGKTVMQAPNDWSNGGYTIHILISENGIVGRYTSHHIPESRRQVI